MLVAAGEGVASIVMIMRKMNSSCAFESNRGGRFDDELQKPETELVHLLTTAVNEFGLQYSRIDAV